MFKIGKIILTLAFCLVPVSLCRAQVVDGNRIMDQEMEENLCALTFDDGPSPNTPELLAILKENNVPATFFILGRNARYYPEIVRQIVAAGHEVENHSWSHPNLKKLSRDAQAREIEETDALLRELGAAPIYVRPPYGNFDERTREIAERLGLSIILWSMDSKDWKRLPENHAKVLSTRGTVYEDGELRGIFLFHDTHKATVDDVPRAIMQLRAGGCQKFVTVGEYLRGLKDPEPSLVMNRNYEPAPAPRVDPVLKYAAGGGDTPLARCSEPWKGGKMDLEEARAALVSSRRAN